MKLFQHQDPGEKDFSSVGLTDIGLVRKTNQDCLVEAGNLVGVADGMGGHQGGETASALARDALIDALKDEVPGPHPVDLPLVEPAGGAVKPRADRFFPKGKTLPEAVRRIALLPVRPVIPGDPGGSPEPAQCPYRHECAAGKEDARVCGLSERGDPQHV